jgi:hypothetical protein
VEDYIKRVNETDDPIGLIKLMGEIVEELHNICGDTDTISVSMIEKFNTLLEAEGIVNEKLKLINRKSE